MNRKKGPSAPPHGSFKEVTKSEAEYGEEIPNQWSFSLKKLNMYVPHTDGNGKETGKSVMRDADVQRRLIIRTDGSASITFDVSSFISYTICMLNEGSVDMACLMELSPNQLHYAAVRSKIIKPGELQMNHSSGYIQFARLRVSGRPGDAITIFLQGIQLERR
ncbi:MAG: DUF6385 domain-containing protein [Bacillus sp. (in: firmicutes)]